VIKRRRQELYPKGKSEEAVEKTRNGGGEKDRKGGTVPKEKNLFRLNSESACELEL